MLTRGASLQQRMVEAIRRHFRDYGEAPSHSELHLAVGIRRNDVGRALRQAAAGRLITFRPGVARGIGLPDRAAMLSDSELELAARARGATIRWPAAAVAPLASAYGIAAGTDCGLPLGELLAQIDAAVEGEADGASGAEAGQRTALRQRAAEGADGAS